MKTYLFIISKLVNIHFRNFFFISFVNLFTILCTALSVTFVILVFSVNSTFKKNIKLNIIKNDGIYSIYKKNNIPINNEEFNQIINLIPDKYSISRLNNQNVIMRNGSKSTVSNMKCIDFGSFNDSEKNNRVFNLDNILTSGKVDDKFILIGHGLAEKLNANVGDKVYIIYKKSDENITFNAFQINVSGIFQTNIPDFDNYTTYVDLSIANELFSLNSNFESLVLNLNDINDANFNSNFQEKQNYIISDEYIEMSWIEKYSYFLNWLSVYDAPINILLFFIMIISIINICSTTYIDNTYRYNQIKLLNKIGLNPNKIAHIFNLKSIILTIVGSMLGFMIVQLLSLLHSQYKLIEIPNEIYYMNELPLEINYTFAFYFIFIMIFIVSILNFLIVNNFLKNKKITS